jgi:hypothetical protein
MTDDEHLVWCADRALAYLDLEPPDPAGAVASFSSDFMKRPGWGLSRETLAAGLTAAASGPAAVRDWIAAAKAAAPKP